MRIPGIPLGRLRGRSPAEFQDRIRQAVGSFAERSGFGPLLGLTTLSLSRILAPGQPEDPDALLRHARARSRPRLIPGIDRAEATAATLQVCCPEAAADVLSRADRISSGRFDLMGYRDLSFGSPIDWQLDPLLHLRAPLAHWSRVPYLDASVVGDHKVVWELNRHQWMITLGQAYALTGDERWARNIVRHMEEWLDANPAKLGINWASSLEVSFRAISWLCSLRFLRPSPSLTPALYARLLQSLHVHGRHLETYLSTYFSPNTHLTGEALGLFYLGTMLPELRAAPRWQRHGLSILQEQLPVQVHPDGVYFEQATQYHRYTTEFYLHLVLLAEANDVPLAPHVRPTLERLFGHLLYMSRPDGTIPLFGDDDGGRLMQLDARTPDDVRALLAAGAVMFGRDAFAFGARGDLAGMVWLVGAEGLQRFQELLPIPPAELARGFADGGYYVSRSSWAPDADWFAFDCGPHGSMNAGHAHADALAIELVVAGRPMFVDAGTYTYPGPERNGFRSTAAHNTVTIDEQSSSVPASAPFRWESIANVQTDAWHTSSLGAFVAGSHDGYAALSAPARHSRAILHLAGDYWIVRDRIESKGTHDVAMRFHCARGLDARVTSDTTPDSAMVDIVDRARNGKLLQMAIFGRQGEARVEDGWVSPQYGARERSKVVSWHQHGIGAQQVVTFLLPSHSIGEAQVQELSDVRGATAFFVPSRGRQDLLLLGEGGPVSAEGVETDAEWLWLRRDSAGRVVRYVAVNASYARSGDDTLWTGGTRLAWRVSAQSEPEHISTMGTGAS